MIKIESTTLEEAYKEATVRFDCSLTEIAVEVVQYPNKGVMGFFKKTAIIVASRKTPEAQEPKAAIKKEPEEMQTLKTATQKESPKIPDTQTAVQKEKKQEEIKEKKQSYQPNILHDTILPESFVSHQDADDYEDDLARGGLYEELLEEGSIAEIALHVKQEINALFAKICFDIDEIEVQVYDSETLLIEFSGNDAALLIGKEGYRYKALSYMIFNWINSKYQLQLRLEIAEFLNNQEEAISKYLLSVCETVEREGRAQTKILDGVLVQIALKQLRETYPDKYVAVRSTRDGLKYIIINDYHNGY